MKYTKKILKKKYKKKISFFLHKTKPFLVVSFISLTKVKENLLLMEKNINS